MKEPEQKESKTFEDVFTRIFGSSSDIKRLALSLSDSDYAVQLVYCQGLCDEIKVEEIIIPELKRIPESILTSHELDLEQKVPFHITPLPSNEIENSLIRWRK